jgi:hypothetical protein
MGNRSSLSFSYAFSGLYISNDLSVNISETIVFDYTGNRKSNGGFSLNIFPRWALHVKYILRIKSENIRNLNGKHLLMLSFSMIFTSKI